MPHVYVSTILARPAAEIWRVIRDFDALPAWTPFVRESRIEGGLPADQVGCVRRFVLTDGGVIRERLLALSDYDLSMSYEILESPMGVSDYIATLSLTPVTETGQTFAAWEARFDCPPGREAALERQIGGDVFAAAFRHFAARHGG